MHHLENKPEDTRNVAVVNDKGWSSPLRSLAARQVNIFINMF